MSSLKQEIEELRKQPIVSFDSFFHNMESALRKHENELCGINATCRFTLTDRGISYGGKISGGHYSPVGNQESVAVTVSGKETDLLNLIRGTLSPAKAVLFGKIHIQGDLQALSAFAPFLG